MQLEASQEKEVSGKRGSIHLFGMLVFISSQPFPQIKDIMGLFSKDALDREKLTKGMHRMRQG